MKLSAVNSNIQSRQNFAAFRLGMGVQTVRFGNDEPQDDKKPKLVDNPNEVKKAAMGLLDPRTEKASRRELAVLLNTSTPDAIEDGVGWAMYFTKDEQKPDLAIKLLELDHPGINNRIQGSAYLMTGLRKEMFIIRLAQRVGNGDVPSPEETLRSFADADEYANRVNELGALSIGQRARLVGDLLKRMDNDKVSLMKTPTPVLTDLKNAESPLAQYIWRAITRDQWGPSTRNQLALRYYQGRLDSVRGLALFMQQVKPMLGPEPLPKPRSSFMDMFDGLLRLLRLRKQTPEDKP